MPRVRLQVDAHIDPEVCAFLIDDLVARQRLRVVAGLVAPEDWRPELTAEMEVDRSRVIAALRAVGIEPPTVQELALTLAIDAFPILRHLERAGDAVLIVEGRYCSREAVDSALDRMRASMKASVEYSPAELREILGVSRKFLIPFLEYCDRRRFTERRDGGRVLIDGMAGGTAIA